MPVYQQKYQIQQQFFNEFIKQSVQPHTKTFDQQQAIPRDFFLTLAESGFLGASIPMNYGGKAWDELSIGLMHEALSKELPSLENILTVIGMVCHSLIRFGSQEQQQTWLPKIARGETLVAIALTEPNIGSDLAGVETTLSEESGGYRLNGYKKYITLGQIADLFLVLANNQEKLTTVLVERDTPGLHISPLSNSLGLRSTMLAELCFENCFIPQTQVLGHPGIGLTHVIATALDIGRYTTAWGCVGLGQACLDAVFEYSKTRTQSGRVLSEHQLIQKMIAEMIVQVKAARELCFYAGLLRQQNDPTFLAETLTAKYFASKMVVLASNHAVQIFGAAGLSEAHFVERYYRDAKVMEIIEGTSQIHEILISKLA